MKKMILVMALMAAALVSASAGAQTITGTPHDLSARLGTGEVCLSCHAPHNAPNPTAGPLWNHALSATTSWGTNSRGAAIKLYSNSLLCMSCHDGVTAVGNFNIANTRITKNSQGDLAMGSLTGANPANVLGTDLSASHPVGVTYGNLTGTDTSSMHTAVVKVSSSGSTSYKIGGTLSLEQGATTGTKDTVGCSTCHTPHSNANGSFLRVSNAGSALCLTCHIH